MQLSVNLEQMQGEFCLRTNFVCTGKLLSVHGHSGAGKTTLLHVLAGLLRPQRGKIVLAGRVLLDTQQGIFVPPRQRHIGYVFQERLLFPHLDVRANLEFGRKNSITQRAFFEVVELFDLTPLLARRTTQLSVGEQQRVAIARALFAAPELLLLDEPMSALDDARKQELIPYLERLRDDYGLPMIYVSHDRREIARLADTEVHLARGEQVGFCHHLPASVAREVRCAS